MKWQFTLVSELWSEGCTCITCGELKVSYLLNLVCKKKRKKKRSKTHKRLKECFLIRQNRTKCANLQGSPLFQATYNNKQQQKNKDLIQLILCQWDVRGWQKEKGMGLTFSCVLYLFSCPFPSASLPHPTDTRWVELFVFLFFVVVVHSLKKRTCLKICTFCPVSSNQKVFF